MNGTSSLIYQLTNMRGFGFALDRGVCANQAVLTLALAIPSETSYLWASTYVGFRLMIVPINLPLRLA